MKNSFRERVITEGRVFTRKYCYEYNIGIVGWRTITRRPLDCYGHIIGGAEEVLRYNPNTKQWETR